MVARRGRQRIKNYYTGDANNAETAELTVDPRNMPGVQARIGSLAVRNIADIDSELYQKYGPNPTDWRLLTGGLANVTILAIPFVVGDWVSSDGGDLYSLTLNHNLSRPHIHIQIFDIANKVVTVHETITINANTLVLKVAQAGIDCRFSGKCVIIG